MVLVAFDFTIDGKPFASHATRIGGERLLPVALDSYVPGTVHSIRYNPNDPRQIATEWNGWTTGKADRLLVAGAALGIILISKALRALS